MSVLYRNSCLPCSRSLREDIISANKDKWALEPSTYIGNGPYKLTSWDHDSKIVFEKNENYWDKNNVIAPKIEWYLMNDQNAILSAFKNGQVAYAKNIPSDELAAEKAAGNLKIFPLIGTYYIDFVNNKPPFNDVRVRKAFSLAIDRNYLVKEIAGKSIADYGAIIIVESLKDAATVVNRIAPEHLELCVKDPFAALGDIKNAGAIFLGNYSTEPLGDYFAGPNHVLPTSGTARFFSPLNLSDFMKKSSIISYTRDALQKVKDDVILFAESEGLGAHANAIRVRFQDGQDK